MNRVHKTPHCHLGLWGYIHMKCFTKKFFNLYFISLLELLVNIPKTTKELFQSLCHQLIRIAGSYPYNHSSLYTLHPVPYTRYSKLSVCQSVTLLNQSSISTSLLRFSCVGLGTSFWFNISSIEQPKCQMSKLWGLSHCDLSNFNHQMIIIYHASTQSQEPVLYSIKWLYIRPRYFNLRVLTSLRYLLYSSCRSLASFSLISSTGRPR